MTSTALVLSDLYDLCNAGEPGETCPHLTLPHISNAEDYSMVESALLRDLIAATTAPNEQMALEHASHVLLLAAAVGYSIGAGDAYNVAISEEITVPDTLAGVDFLGDE